MNKSEKIICVVLAAILGWYLFMEIPKAKRATESINAKDAKVATETSVTTRSSVCDEIDFGRGDCKQEGEGQREVEVGREAKKLPAEEVAFLENDEVKVELTNHGAAVKRVTLKKFAKNRGKISEENPPVVLDFSENPMGAIEPIEAFELVENDGKSIVYRVGTKTRKITLGGDYKLEFEDDGIAGVMSIGAMRMGDSKNDLLSVDSWAVDAGKSKPGIVHHCEGSSPLKAYLVGGVSGGCSGSKSAAGMPAVQEVGYPGAQTYVAIKNRFFVTALASASEANNGFSVKIARDVKAASYKPESVAAKVDFSVTKGEKRTMVFYAGPKKQSLLWALGMKDVMEFGMWRWICYPLVWVLNLFNDWIPNYGVAIILLTILVRILFWPLTHKSTVGMKKMQEIQPLMKEIQAKYKGNPQRLQQETMQLYRDHKVNPMSSCLPMLIQIPVFIALFNVLRSAVELRYAPFLWIGDLSEPEGILAAYLPFGGINLLPILMAVSTGLQSYFTPSTGDKSQQKMMMVFMPIMMLVMFYSFPSALSLYWFLSNIFSIVQMWLIRRQTAAKRADGVIIPEVIEPSQTRQMKRHS